MKNKVFICLFLFLFVFLPPFLPISSIYVLGPTILALLFFKYKNKKEIRSVFWKSRMSDMLSFIIIMTLYITIVNILDMFIVSDKDLLMARLRSYNQLLVLSVFQFAFVLYVILMLRKEKCGLEDAIRYLVYVGCLQGILALVAYIFPPVRSLFMTFGNQALTTNEFYMEKRGFGFSENLIDTFGYGMGLISGYVFLFKWSKNFGNIVLVFSCLLSLFAIVVNARTGILVLLLAIFIRIAYDRNILVMLLKLAILGMASSFIMSFANKLILMGMESSNYTINWISMAFYQISNLLADNNASSSEDLSFISYIVELPSNGFEYIFGTGHWIYDTRRELGFRTDIGWYNLLWEFGVVGTFVVMSVLTFFMLKPFFISEDISVKRIALFNTISYYVVLIKAILLGSNPGTFVLYYSTFCIYYFIWRSELMKRSLNKGGYYISTI